MSRLNNRIKNFQKGLDTDQVRKKLEDGAIELRKKKRIEHIAKKRALNSNFPQATVLTEGMSDLIPDASLISVVLLEAEPRLCHTEIPPTQRLLILLNLIRTYDDLKVLQAAVYTLRVILSSQKFPPLEAVVQSGVVSKIIALLDSEDDTIKIESAWCITNIACCPTHITAYLVNEGAVEKIFKLLNCINTDIVYQAIWALGNIAGDSVEYRDRIIELGTVKILLKLIDHMENITDNQLSTIVWFLSNLLKGKPQPNKSARDKIVGYLPDIFKSKNDSVLSDACWCTSYITDGDDSGIDSILTSSIIGKIIELTSSSNNFIQTPALRTIGNIATGQDAHLQTLLNLGIIDKLSSLISSSLKHIRKESLWALSNIIAGSSEQVELVIYHPIFQQVLKEAREIDLEIKKEAMWCITNATYLKNVKHIIKLVDLGVMEILVECLEFPDPRVLFITLDAINNILRAGVEILLNDETLTFNNLAAKFDEIGGLEKLESLQSHANPSVYSKVVSIMDAYYGLEDVEDEQKHTTEVPTPDNFVFS